MYLKELSISGFKSFADRTRLDLRRGVTAVVGPNGCGKSNIVDAIRWVLGEQSAKALRGASMQDVIFEGTDKRRSLPFCEVTLTFTDCEAELGTAFNEVEVSRRVSREGGSEYFINGKSSRLKDIQRLFANTGVGRVSYSFMLQGQIDQILSTNPAERRVIFEEAAGITLYKAQRKEALNKLALVDANLARVTDVIEEVSRQIGSLKRQASKALRYQRLQHRYSHLDLALGSYRHANLRTSIDAIAARADTLRKNLEAHTESLSSEEAALLEHKNKRTESFESMQELQQRVYNLRSEKENADNQSEFASIRVKDLQGRIEDFKREIKDLEGQKAELASKAQDETANKQMQLDVVDDSDRIFQDRSNELVKAQEQLGSMEAELQDRRQNILHAENRINRARSNCTTLEVDLKTYQVKHAALAEAQLELKAEVEELERAGAELNNLLAKRQAEVAQNETALEQARESSTLTLENFRKLQESIQDQDRGIARKAAQLHILEGLQAKFEGFGEGAKAILEDRLGEVISKDSVSILSKALKVQPEFTKPLESLLGSAMEALFVGDSDKALSVIRKLGAESLGRACVQIDVDAVTAPSRVSLPESIRSAVSVVTVREDILFAPVQRLLAGCYFVDDLETFIEFWKAHPEFNFLIVATREGEVLDCRGLIHGGRASGQQPSSVLEREADIRRLRGEIETERKDLNQLRAQAAEVDEARNSAEGMVETRRQRLAELNNEVSALNAEARGQSQKLEQNKLSRSNGEVEIRSLDSHHAEAIQALETAKEELLASESALELARQSGTDHESAITQAREQRDLKREALADVRLELAEKKQRLASLDRSLGEVQRESTDLQERILRRNQEIDNINEQIAKLQGNSTSEQEKSTELKRTLEVAMKQLDHDREALKALDVKLAAMDSALVDRRKESRIEEQELNKLDVRLAEERSQIGFIENSSRETHQVELSEVNWKKELWEAAVEFEKKVNLDEVDDPDQISAKPKTDRPEPTEEELAEMDCTDWSAIEQEVKEYKGRLSSMGPVNLEAISEYTDLKERHDFLKGQSEDLWNSKNALVQSIDSINETSQNLFRDTFEQVRKNFAFTYDKLSGGGESDLKLIDAEDPLESGIEIIARPPGTRLKSVTLLSGGQRTMAAVALLFAIYLVKPSPFCVLDEIDAALDDANIGRFCETLHGFTDKSQFLIITHNKRTISNADTVFGVTMPEKGVSTLISMRFNKDSSRPEIAGA
jgi:chromosome segregation protein